MRTASFWLNFFLVCAGMVLGAMLAEITAGTPKLQWLSYGMNFGTESPLTLNLGILRLTFGITFNFTVSTAVCIAIMLLLGNLISRR